MLRPDEVDVESAPLSSAAALCNAAGLDEDATGCCAAFTGEADTRAADDTGPSCADCGEALGAGVDETASGLALAAELASGPEADELPGGVGGVEDWDASEVLLNDCEDEMRVEVNESDAVAEDGLEVEREADAVLLLLLDETRDADAASEAAACALGAAEALAAMLAEDTTLLMLAHYSATGAEP